MSDIHSIPEEPRDVATPKKRGHAVLVTLLALFGASMACIVVVFDACLTFEETQAKEAVLERTSARRAARQRVRRHAQPVEDATAAADSESGAARSAAPRAGVVPSSRFVGGRPDATTPRGRKLHDDLLVTARGEPDATKRAAAVRSLGGMFGTQASVALSGIADDPTQPVEVRGLAAKAGRNNVEGGK